MTSPSPGADAHADVDSQCLVAGAAGAEPRLSIMIPTYRRPALLRQAIDSALAQAGEVAFEVVVVDNDAAAGPDVEALVRGYGSPRLRLFRNARNIGMFGNWNRCARLSRADWFTILSDDDLLSPNYVETVAAEIRPGRSFIAALQVVMDDRPGAAGGARGPAPPRLEDGPPSVVSRRDITFINGIGNASGVLIHKPLFHRLGGFDETLFPSSDYALWLALCDAGEALRVPACRSYYRIAVNESLKPDVLAGFVVQDYELRRRYLPQARWPAAFRLLMKLAAARDVKRFRQRWGVDIARHPHLRRIGFNASWRLLPSRWIHLIHRCLAI